MVASVQNLMRDLMSCTFIPLQLIVTPAATLTLNNDEKNLTPCNNGMHPAVLSSASSFPKTIVRLRFLLTNPTAHETQQSFGCENPASVKPRRQGKCYPGGVC